MIALSDILHSYGHSYLEKYSAAMPYIHKQTIRNILQCRTEKMGGQAYYCDDCNQYRFSYHSCGDRNCNKCQNDKAKLWFNKVNSLLLPVTHFLVTFTIPETLRQFTRANQVLFYNILFKAASQSLQTLAWDPKYVGGRIAMMAVLHTWSRTLNFHPHLHCIVPGGGLWEDGNLWLQSSEKFLVPVCALSKLFRAEMQKLIKKHAPELYNSIPGKLWNQKWVVHCKAVGTGEKAVQYLSEYIFRPAISNNRIISMDDLPTGKAGPQDPVDNFVTFSYRDNKTNFKKTMKLSSEEFIRRYLQHVLPKGFVKVRYFGLFSQTNRKLLSTLKDNFSKKTSGQRKDNPQDPVDSKVISVESDKSDKSKIIGRITCLPDRQVACPCCNKPMQYIGSFNKFSYMTNAPPGNTNLNTCQKVISN